MRYAQGGGLTAAEQAKREQLRLEAAEMFELGATQAEVAEELRVSRMSASRWYRDWKARGTAGLLSRGPGGLPCRLDDRQLARLEAALRCGPAADGFDDQVWTGARVAELIERMFGVRYTARGASLLLHRLGWSVQQPVHRAAERDEQAVRRWREEEWPTIVEKAEGAWICFEDEAAACLRPPKGRTWARRGCTPVLPVCGRGSGRMSIAGMVCAKPGEATRLARRTRVHTHRTGERRSMSEADYATLISSFHDEVDAPLVLVWDNLNTHTSTDMQVFLDANAACGCDSLADRLPAARLRPRSQPGGRGLGHPPARDGEPGGRREDTRVPGGRSRARPDRSEPDPARRLHRRDRARPGTGVATRPRVPTAERGGGRKAGPGRAPSDGPNPSDPGRRPHRTRDRRRSAAPAPTHPPPGLHDLPTLQPSSSGRGRRRHVGAARSDQTPLPGAHERSLHPSRGGSVATFVIIRW